MNDFDVVSSALDQNSRIAADNVSTPQAWFNNACRQTVRDSNPVDNELDNDTRRQMIELRLEHRDLDEAIMRMANDPTADQLRLRRLKKRKLLIKDAIARLESKLIPDLDA